MMLVGSLF